MSLAVFAVGSHPYAHQPRGPVGSRPPTGRPNKAGHGIRRHAVDDKNGWSSALDTKMLRSGGLDPVRLGRTGGSICPPDPVDLTASSATEKELVWFELG